VITVQFAAVTAEEITQCFALHMGYCRDNPDAPDWQEHYDRAQHWSRLLPDCPLEDQIKVYEAAL